MSGLFGKSELEVLGVANILPLDHTYVVSKQSGVSLTHAVAHLRAHPPAESANPIMGFSYSGYQRSGGGRIANILAYLGTHGHRVAACGVVGSDVAGDLVRHDLEEHKVRTDHVRSREGCSTRVVFIVSNGASSYQVHIKPPHFAKLSVHDTNDLPESSVLLVGRFNKSTLAACTHHREVCQSRIAVHIGSAPRWNSERRTIVPLLELADVAVFSAAAAKVLGGGGLGVIPSRLAIMYEGINRVEARTSAGARFSVNYGQYVAVSDPTGMVECFHGAFLSFLIRSGWQIEDDDVVKAGLHFANEVAGFSGTGIGARHFPLSAQNDFVRARHWESIQRRHAIFVSHSTSDEWLVAKLRKRLNNEPGTKVWVNDANPGDTVWEAVAAALAASNICIVIVTRGALSSRWVRQEVAFTQEPEHRGTIRLVPLVVATDCSAPELWLEACSQWSLPVDLVYIDATTDVADPDFPREMFLDRLRRAWKSG